MRPKELHQRLIEKYGPVIDLRECPALAQDLLDEVRSGAGAERPQAVPEAASPYGVSWMDSWVAHWVYNERLRAAETRVDDVRTVLRALTDLKFNERLGEIRRIIKDLGGVMDPDGGPPDGPPNPGPGPASLMQPGSGPPDAGPPEPGVPPAGPSRFFAQPDGGPPEPGVPPDPSPPPGPDGGPPEPGVPPTGPESVLLRENPWILYWFVSIKAPMLLDMIDAHLTSRLDKMMGR